MTTIFTKGDVKRKFLTVESKDRTEMSYLQSELDTLEAEDCLIVDVKVLKSLVIDDSLYHTTYMIEYIEPKYELIDRRRAVYDIFEETVGMFDDLDTAKTAKAKESRYARIVTHYPRELEFR